MTLNNEAAVLMLAAGAAWGFARLLADACFAAAWLLRKLGPEGPIMAWYVDDPDAPATNDHIDDSPPFGGPGRDWSVEILTLAADIVDESGRATFGRDEAKAIRDVLGRLPKGAV